MARRYWPGSGSTRQALKAMPKFEYAKRAGKKAAGDKSVGAGKGTVNSPGQVWTDAAVTACAQAVCQQ
jgi:hypothetical protein